MKMVIGSKYNWKNQPERLIYLGYKVYPGNGGWHQFAKVEKPSQIWCEIRTEDLEMFEETKA